MSSLKYKLEIKYVKKFPIRAYGIADRSYFITRYTKINAISVYNHVWLIYNLIYSSRVRSYNFFPTCMLHEGEFSIKIEYKNGQRMFGRWNKVNVHFTSTYFPSNCKHYVIEWKFKLIWSKSSLFLFPIDDQVWKNEPKMLHTNNCTLDYDSTLITKWNLHHFESI